jgi:hypothetical protein
MHHETKTFELTKSIQTHLLKIVTMITSFSQSVSVSNVGIFHFCFNRLSFLSGFFLPKSSLLRGIPNETMHPEISYRQRQDSLIY